jgi:hypothetical protein
MVNGTCFAGMFQSNGTNQAWPGVASGYIALLPHANYGAVLGGTGTTADTSLFNSTGNLAAYVPHGTTDFNVAGNLQMGGTTTIDAGRNATLATIAASSVATTGSILSSGGGGVGYSTGAGGTVTQATSKSTGVTLNKVCGQITMNADALAASTTISFLLTNSFIAASDLLILNHVSGGTAGSYAVNAQCGDGTAIINVSNIAGTSLSEAIVIGFAVHKAATA